MADYTKLQSQFSLENALEYVTDLELQLSHTTPDSEPTDYADLLQQLTWLIKQLQGHNTSDSEPETKQSSLNVTRLAARVLVTVLGHLPSKVYDVANELLGHFKVDEFGALPTSAAVATVVLIDVIDAFPLAVSSLLNFGATQIYKVVKKTPIVDCKVVFLLASILKNASKADIDEKFSAKLVKVAVKAIQQPIIVGGKMDEESASNIALTKYYICALKNALILQVASNYQSLLEFSTSSSSGTKMKPEAIMTSQHQFQMSILNTHEKTFQFCLQSHFAEIRAAAVDLIANVLVNFVATGKFNGAAYLIDLYPLAEPNLWDESLAARIGADSEPVVEQKKEKNFLTHHDSESIINANSNLLHLQIGCVEAFTLYTQMESLQDPEYLSSSLVPIIEAILVKFSDMNDTRHIQNSAWVRTLSHWSTVLEFLFTECGSSAHETLAQFIVQQFSLSYSDSSRDVSPTLKSGKEKKKESSLFSFKSSRSSKNKAAAGGQIDLYSNPYQLKLVLDLVTVLLPYGLNFNSMLKSDDLESEQNSADSIDGLVEEEESKTTSKRNSYVSDLLLSLLVNENEYIRNYALVTLTDFAKINHSESNHLILNVFSLVSREFNNTSQAKDSGAPKDRNISSSGSVRLYSYALALSALIKCSDATELQNSTIAKILSFCTQNLKHNANSGSKLWKNGICWVILSSLVTFYPDFEYVKLNSSQFLVFWKSLLTSQFVSTGLTEGAADGDASEIVVNLKLRTLSLICLLNYISAVDLTPEMSKQLQFLLVKSQKYLIYLESNLDRIGLVTAFSPQAFNECDYNPNLVNNILFSNFSHNSKLLVENQLISLIIYNKKIVMQGFTKLANTLKGDVNSSLVVFLSKVFSDPKGFSRLALSEYGKEMGKSSKNKQTVVKLSHEDLDKVDLDEEYNYNFGLTSKFQGATPEIDVLHSQSLAATARREGFFFRDAFSSSQKSQDEQHGKVWTDAFESTATSIAAHSINFDPVVLILNEYSSAHSFAPNLITSMVDLSIELFQQVFSGLSYKIQFSLLEQLRSSVTSKNADPLRMKALVANVAVAIHGLLSNLIKKQAHLNDEIIEVILEILDALSPSGFALVSICADSVGLASSLLSKAKAEELVAKYIGKIVSETSPLVRGRLLLNIAQIHKSSHTAFSEIHNVIVQLVKDSHPIVSFYTLESCSILFENAIGNQTLIVDMVEVIHSLYVEDTFDYKSGKGSYVNSTASCHRATAIVSFLRSCVSSLGPNIRTTDQDFRKKLFQLILCFSRGIGAIDSKDVSATLTGLLKMGQELIVFDPNFAEGFAPWFTEFCYSLIKMNMKTGIEVVSPTSINTDTLFPITTSQQLAENAFACLIEMEKVGIFTLSKAALNLAWISMQLRPCENLKTLISYWVDSKMDTYWFSQLTSLYNFSSRRLVGAFLEVNYQQKLLPLQQRQKKTNKSDNVDFTDEEAQNIVNEDAAGDDKNQPVSWEFKQLIYELLTGILTSAEKNALLTEKLKPRIQEIIRMSFLGTTSPIPSIKISGVSLLDKGLQIFGHMEDPLYPGVSILEQQQAQIISALIPCFGSDSDAEVIVKAINVSSRFINLPNIKFYSKQRILKTMIYLLEEISSNKFLKFVFLESMAEYGRKSIQLSILNCWAVLSIKLSENERDSEPEFREILSKYSKLLISLWILVLKELSNLRYNSPKSKEIHLYGNYWLNFVEALTSILEKDPATIKEYLQEDETDFFFVMFCQCSEALIKNQDVSQALVSMTRLVKIPDLAKILFEDDLFGEIVDLFDRLILMESDVQIKGQVTDTINSLSGMFSKLGASNDEDKNTPKLFEILRVAMLPLFEEFPFLRQDYVTEDEAKETITDSKLAMAKTQFSAILDMIEGFPSGHKPDLYSCMLYIFAKIYEFGDDALITATLPFIKRVVPQIRGFEKDIVSPFVEILKRTKAFTEPSSKVSYMVTNMILISGGCLELSDTEAEALAETLLNELGDKELASTSVQSIKTLVALSSESKTVAFLKRFLLKSLLESLVGDSLDKDTSVDTRVLVELVMLFNNAAVLDTTAKATSLYSILVPMLLDYDQKSVFGKDYLHQKLVDLLQKNTESFKSVVTGHLDDEQRRAAEELVKFSQNGGQASSIEETIQLRSFG